jgi:hypothetical protein
MILQTTLIILSFIFVLTGIIGILIPFLPGVSLAWIGLLIFALTTSFAIISMKQILIFLALVLIVTALDFIIPLVGAKKYRASKEGISGALLGSFIGFFAAGPLGVVLGMLSGLVFGEMFKGRDSRQVKGVLRGAVLGFLLGGLIKIILVIVMLAYLIIGVFKL